MHHFRRLAKGYMKYILIGAILLFLPISHKSGEIPAFIDVLFTATSAITTTGLYTINTADYTAFGQGVILLLIQLGGIGYMSFGAFLLMARTTSVDSDTISILNKSFTLPSGFDVTKFVRQLIIYTIVIEVIGALLLLPFFWGVESEVNAIWSAIFHSISAFCTAGFSLYPDNLEQFVNHIPINLIMSTLSLLGAIGFIVLSDVVALVKDERDKLTFTSRVILVGIFGTITTVVLFNAIWTDMSPLENIFQTISAMSGAGFNTGSVVTYTNMTLMLMMIIMFIGGAPSGTAGGVKITSFTAILAAVKGYVLDMEPSIRQNVVPRYRIRSALAVIITYLSLLAIGVVALTILMPTTDLTAILFEIFSALSTVGLSMGVTEQLPLLGKILIIFLMFAGRIGTRTIFFLALSIREKDLRTRKKRHSMKLKKEQEDIAC